MASVRPSLMDPMSRKRSVHNCQWKVKSGKVVRFRIFRNASDGDSGFDSALSSRSSSISLDQVSSHITNRMSTDLVYHQCGGSFWHLRRCCHFGFCGVFHMENFNETNKKWKWGKKIFFFLACINKRISELLRVFIAQQLLIETHYHCWNANVI